MKAGIALGTNLGDREKNLEAGFAFLKEISSNREILRSSVIETEPVDCPPGSQRFLNAVAEIDYSGTIHELHRETKKIEELLGRNEKRVRNAPRPLDLDILYFGDLIVNEPNLIVPHPRMTERRFVLEPLAEIRAELVLPGQSLSILELLQSLKK